MLKVAVYNQEGKQVKDTELNELVFGIEPNKQSLIWSYYKELHGDKELIKSKTVLKSEVEEENHGDKKVQVELDKDLSALHNGEVGELYLVLHQEAIHLS